MEVERFKASRWTRGNHWFPTVIEVSDMAIIRHKRTLFSKDEISISMSKVASVHIKTGFWWSDIVIESSGGTDPLSSHGHRKADAKRIRDLVQQARCDALGTEHLFSSESGDRPANQPHKPQAGDQVVVDGSHLDSIGGIGGP